jgi:hypothetical protein
LKVDRGRAAVGVAELALGDVQRHALAASPSACAWRSWCGALLRLRPEPAPRSQVAAAALPLWRASWATRMTMKWLLAALGYVALVGSLGS